MGKDKLRRFRENLTFECFVQPEFDEVFHRDHPLKGNWNRDFFRNDNPIVLELGCGKGEYTVALAQRDPQRNYIGIDIKAQTRCRSPVHEIRHEIRHSSAQSTHSHEKKYCQLE